MAVKRQIAVAAAAIALIGGGVAIWQLRPQATSAGSAQKLGELDGFAVYSVPAPEDGELLQIRHNGKAVWSGPEGTFVRVSLLSTDVDIAGGPKADIVATGWTGGASCCQNYVVFSTEGGGKILGSIPRQGGDTRAFVRSAVPGLPKATLPSFDLAAMGNYGGNAGSPLARVFVAYNGSRFGLDAGRMKAASAEAAPNYMLADPALVAAIAPDAMEDDFVVPDNAAGVQPAYAEWVATRLTSAAGDELLDPANPESFITPALVLNEYVYKGQALAGLAALEKTFEKRPGLAQAIFRHYFSVMLDSQWVDDLDTMNDGALKPLLAKYAKAL